MIGIGTYAAVRMVAIPMHETFASFSMVFSVWALVTMVYGGFMALAQDDIKRFLAYSSVSQMGYLFLGLASATAYGEAGAIFHYVSHGFGKCILFCAIIMTVLTVGYSLWTVRRIFFGPLAEGMEDVKEGSMLMLVPMAVFAVISIVIGVYPRLVLDYLLPFFG